MPTNTYVALDKVTVSGTSTTSVTLSSIPATYTDLVLVINAKNDTLTNTEIRFNGDTGSNYSNTMLSGNGTSATSARESNNTSISIDNVAYMTTGDFAYSNIIQIMNYANTTTNKTLLTRANSAANGVDAIVGLWRNTAAITSLTILTTTGTRVFAAGSTFSLYGISAQPVAVAKATGGTIYYGADGYTYHKFTATGTFTPSQALSCETLVSAGGGAGGYNGGGGGGAGGFRVLTSQSFSSGVAYTATVGAGGSPNNSNGTVGGSGTTSTITGSGFTTIASSGGGGGGAQSVNGATGGSGGAGGKNGAAGAAGNSGSYSPVEGFAGGNSNGGAGAGGGGGATTVGALGTSNGGAGGTGSSAYSTWLSITSAGVSGAMAGGGGGGSDNTGGSATNGGGAGGSTNGNGTAGTANTSGGGGGGGTGGSAGSGAAGGSGLVIIRYAS
jgi:hypothetical protein